MSLAGRRVGALACAVVLVASACGDDDDGDDGASSTPEPEKETLRILVSNDDGVESEGIAALVEGLDAMQDVEVLVSAPADDKTATSDHTTPELPEATDTTLPGGREALAVAGFPADSVIYGLDEALDEEPHVVVTGINKGQNIGLTVDFSGTVGAARTAARRGIPALAVSQGLADTYDWTDSVELAVEWVEDHREDLLAGDVPTDTIANLNVPTCTTGELRGVKEVPTEEASGDVDTNRHIGTESDCESTTEDVATDVDAFLNGYAALSEVGLEDKVP